MGDTVKLIIEIPKETKQAFDKAEYNYLKGGYYDLGGVIGKAIQNGIPLDSAIEEYVERGATTENMIMLDKIDSIKAEITTYKDDKIIHFESNCMIDIVLDIIDKHMRGET